MDVTLTIATALPSDIARLNASAMEEGVGLVDRLMREWRDGTQLFEGEDECLLIARVGDEIAGVGGITRDPGDPSSLRMRRFYVLPRFRRRGVARKMVDALLARVAPDRKVGVHVGPPEALPFWRKMGFESVDPAHAIGITHMLSRHSRRS